MIDEFLAFVEEHRDGWTVLFRELNASRPLAEQVAQLRAQIVAEVRRMLEGDGAAPWPARRPPPRASPRRSSAPASRWPTGG